MTYYNLRRNKISGDSKPSGQCDMDAVDLSLDDSVREQSVELFMWSAIKRHKMAALGAWLTICIPFAYVWFTIPNTYEAVSYILISSDRVNSSTTEAAAQEETFRNTQVYLLSSGKVMSEAIKKVDLRALEVVTSPPIKWLRIFLRRPESDSSDALVSRLSSSLKIQLEPKSSLIRVAFISRDSKIGADFVNAVVAAYFSQYKQLYAASGTSEFLDSQLGKLNRELFEAAGQLSTFSTQNRVYAIAQQRDGLLAQLSRINGTIAATQAGLNQKANEQASVEVQLARLPSRVRSSGEGGGLFLSDSPGATKGGANSTITSDPPLLLVKVYQDMAELIVMRAMEKSGLSATLQVQGHQAEVTQHELDALILKEAEFKRLQRNVADLEQERNSLRRKADEEGLRATMAIRDLSSVRIAETAAPSDMPVGPSVLFLVALLGGSVLCGIGAALALEVRRPRCG